MSKIADGFKPPGENFTKNTFDNFHETMKGLVNSVLVAKSGVIDTGTVVFALLTADKQKGIIFSDGRVSGGSHIVSDEFPKFDQLYSGFIGFSGMMGLAQEASQAYKNLINDLWRDRNTLTVKGSARLLEKLYKGIGSYTEEEIVAFLGLFRGKDRDCICGDLGIYEYWGGAEIKREYCGAIGSGAVALLREVNKLEATPPDTLEQAILVAFHLLQDVFSVSTSCNGQIFFGIIDNAKEFIVRGKVCMAVITKDDGSVYNAYVGIQKENGHELFVLPYDEPNNIAVLFGNEKEEEEIETDKTGDQADPEALRDSDEGAFDSILDLDKGGDGNDK